MSRSRLLSSIAAASLGIALLGACSAESLTERAVSFGLEQAAEGDQDIDLDFGSDGGGFSISTDEGDFAINFDEDSGGIVYDTDEGTGTISLTEDGIVYNTDEGDGVISFDEDNGAINFATDEGDGQITFDDESGAITFGTDGDGGAMFFGSTEVPDGWPSEVGMPATLVPGGLTFSAMNLGPAGSTVIGGFDHHPDEPFAAQVVANLQASGWANTFSSNDGGSTFVQLTKNGETAQIIGDNDGFTTVMLSTEGA